MVSTAEKIRFLDVLIKEYPEKAFLRDIRKSYEQKSELEDILKPGECIDVKLTDEKNEPIINAHICKTKNKN